MIHKAGVTLFKLVPEYMFINQMIILTVISIVSIVLLKQNKSLKHMRVYIKNTTTLRFNYFTYL